MSRINSGNKGKKAWFFSYRYPSCAICRKNNESHLANPENNFPMIVSGIWLPGYIKNTKEIELS